jgi:hypothetical protein
MRALAKEIAGGLAFVAIGVVVSLAVVLPQSAGASPDPGVSYVWRGVTPWTGWHCYPWGQFSGWDPCWHTDEGGGDYKAVDYDRSPAAGTAVYLDYSGDGQLFKIMPYQDNCTGVVVEIYQGSYDPANKRGEMHYLHIQPNDYWLYKEVPNLQVIWIGNVLEQEAPNCYWTAAHLHQSADVSSSTPFYANKLADPSQDDEWEHAIFWGAPGSDNDGDGWTNANELYIGTDPYDRCPDNPSDAAWPVDIDNDTWCNVIDILQFKPHLGCSVGDDCYDNRLDVNTDGIVNVLDILMFKPYLSTRCT